MNIVLCHRTKFTRGEFSVYIKGTMLCFELYQDNNSPTEG